MMRIKLRKDFAVLILSLLMGGSSVCYSQSLAQASKLGVFLDNNISELNRVQINLLQMDDPATSVEPYISNVTELIGGAIQAISNVSEYSTIYSLMVDTKDQSTVKKFLSIKAKNSIIISKYCVDKINKSLVRFKSPAAVSEVQGARDLILKMQAEITRVVPVNLN